MPSLRQHYAGQTKFLDARNLSFHGFGMRSTTPLVLALLVSLAIHTQAANPAFAKVTDDPKLPRVLLVGDSISIAYTVPTRDLLKGKANVHRIPTNAGHTGMGIAGLPKWLKKLGGKWDVIHFNWGLWDLCYRNPKSKNQGRRDKVSGKLTHTIGQYTANLEKPNLFSPRPHPSPKVSSAANSATTENTTRPPSR